MRNRTMLPEWAPLQFVQLTWPHEATDWNYMLPEVEACYLNMAREIARRTQLLIVTPHVEATKQKLVEHLSAEELHRIKFFSCETNDTWARDHAFITVQTEEKGNGKRHLHLMDYRFDGWGGKFEATLDNAINRRLYDASKAGTIGSGSDFTLEEAIYDNCLDFTLEGGSLESDGAGTLLTTSQCLLNPNRNPSYSKSDIENRLCKELGADRILWLDYGYLAGDDTDSHIDTLARLCPADTILYVACDDAAEEHYKEQNNIQPKIKKNSTTDGKPYRLLPLPLPSPIICDGERLPATYANYLALPDAVLVPIYNQAEKDSLALDIIGKAFPGCEIVGIDCRVLIKQHGSLHCATMQYPSVSHL